MNLPVLNRIEMHFNKNDYAADETMFTIKLVNEFYERNAKSDGIIRISMESNDTCVDSSEASVETSLNPIQDASFGSDIKDESYIYFEHVQPDSFATESSLYTSKKRFDFYKRIIKPYPVPYRRVEGKLKPIYWRSYLQRADKEPIVDKDKLKIKTMLGDISEHENNIRDKLAKLLKSEIKKIKPEPNLVKFRPSDPTFMERTSNEISWNLHIFKKKVNNLRTKKTRLFNRIFNF